MKIREAGIFCREQIRILQEQQTVLSKKKKDLDKKIRETSEGRQIYGKEAAIVELSMEAVREKQSAYEKYMETLTEHQTAMQNMIAAGQQEDAMEEGFTDLGKIMEVARRLMMGGIVPANDERKLMEYSMELYQAAKNMGAMAKEKEREEYDSLWEETEKKVYREAEDTAAELGAPAGMPTLLSGVGQEMEQEAVQAPEA